jgi:hypothetical protein
MWLCSNCGHKNNNSNLKCHGINCKAERNYAAIEQPIKVIKEKGMKKVYDFCPKCHKDTFWTPARFKGKQAWRCVSCKKVAFLIGKPKPFPIEVETI